MQFLLFIVSRYIAFIFETQYQVSLQNVFANFNFVCYKLVLTAVDMVRVVLNAAYRRLTSSALQHHTYMVDICTAELQ